MLLNEAFNLIVDNPEGFVGIASLVGLAVLAPEAVDRAIYPTKHNSRKPKKERPMK